MSQVKPPPRVFRRRAIRYGGEPNNTVIYFTGVHFCFIFKKHADLTIHPHMEAPPLGIIPGTFQIRTKQSPVQIYAYVCWEVSELQEVELEALVTHRKASRPLPRLRYGAAI